MIIRGETAATSSGPNCLTAGGLRATERGRRNNSGRTCGLHATRSTCSFHLDRDWRITGVTVSAAAWFGIEKAQMIGTDARERIVMPRQLATAIASCLEAQQPSVIACRSACCAGRWTEYSVDPTAGGAVVRFRHGS